jgi:hypothetical protein
MLLSVVGGLTTGMMWGWLLSARVRLVCVSPETLLLICGATLLFGTEIFSLTDSQTVSMFFAGALLSWALHSAWIFQLRSKSAKKEGC